jgi:hypothetical protein
VNRFSLWFGAPARLWQQSGTTVTLSYTETGVGSHFCPLQSNVAMIDGSVTGHTVFACVPTDGQNVGTVRVTDDAINRDK